jgi:tetratricopeptide (TPR) repeat protein
MDNKLLIIFMTLSVAISCFSGCGDSEKKAKALYYEAQALIRDGKEDEGKKLFNKLISKYPETVTAANANKDLNKIYATEIFLKAQALMRSSKLNEAEKLFNEIIFKYPESEAAANANDGLIEISKLKSILLVYDATAKVNLFTATLAQKSYFTNNSKFCKSLDQLATGNFKSLNDPDDDVNLSILSADDKSFLMECYHEKGTKIYSFKGPEGSIEERSR